MIPLNRSNPPLPNHREFPGVSALDLPRLLVAEELSGRLLGLAAGWLSQVAASVPVYLRHFLQPRMIMAPLVMLCVRMWDLEDEEVVFNIRCLDRSL